MRHLAFGFGSSDGSVDDSNAVYRQLTVLATATASAMIAQQVAGKAIRDALFLSTFYVKSLPAMMAGGAIASLASVITISRLLARRSPSDVLPFLFGTNAIAIAAAFVTFFRAPRVSALIVYLAMAVLGPVILSTFWSVINEHFDPHRAKRAVARITAGATLGGVIGGLATWGLSRQLTLASAVGFLALLNLACVGGALALRRKTNTDAAEELSGATDAPAPSSSTPARSPFAMLRHMPFLRSLAALMALGSASSTLLDYTFSAKATHLLGSGPSLLAFFSLFGIAVSILSFIVQIAVGKVAIERLGLMVNVAALQVLVVGGCVLALLAPGMSSLTLLRGAEMVHRNSLFKSAYELFYTPIPDARRRVTKAIIDVGFDRIGTVLGSGVALLVLWRSSREEVRLLWVVAVIALACLPLAKWLHRGYVATLAQDLREAAPLTDRCPKPEEPEHEILIERIEAVRHPEDQTGSTRIIRERADEIAARATSLLRGDHEEVRTALESWEPHHAVLVPLAAPHLAEPALRGCAQAAIRSVARDVVGALTDIFLDTKVSFAVRRRVGPILATCRTQRAADGLIAALSDERLEVRYVAGRALLTLTEGRYHGIEISPDLVVRLVREELERVEEANGDGKDKDDRDDDERQASLFDAIARVRISRRLEHVFNILALAMDREPLRLAFRAIHHPNERHRGTALEYIQTVLPTDVREPLWPMIAPGRELLPAPREAAEVLAELARLLDEPKPPAMRE